MADTSLTSKRSLLSSAARIQVPFVSVTIGDYTFGVARSAKEVTKQYSDGFYQPSGDHYPNYVKSLNVVKVNGQINQYTLSIVYPITQFDDPNFFEKVFSSVSTTREITFSYGDWSTPTYIYKNEKAIITSINSSFSFGQNGSVSSVISYTVKAVSSAQLSFGGNFPFPGKKAVPSTEIKNIFKNKSYGLQDIFTGMNVDNLDSLIESGDKEVQLQDKMNISPIDYISYLVSCMIPVGTSENNISKDIYILTLHDDTTFDRAYTDREIVDGKELVGAYFKVTKQSYNSNKADAFEIDLGTADSSTIVTAFSLKDQENYALIYDYQQSKDESNYKLTLNSSGEYEEIFAPSISSKNNQYYTRPEDISWWTKITKYPISASITIQGLLRPALLMQYVRLNVLICGRPHISSGLYIITKQVDDINENGYRTTLELTKINS